MGYATFVCFVLCGLGTPIAAAGDCMKSDVQNWLTAERATFDKLAPLLSCPASVGQNEGKLNDRTPCNYFVAKATKIVYGVGDFVPRNPETEWPAADAIIASVQKDKNWHAIGNANVQGNLDLASAKARDMHAVIAGRSGHVALVLPGKVVESGWTDKAGKHLSVPNSASFHLDDVKQTYVFCRLSAAWRADQAGEVVLYYRDKP